jgi:hypothetical protein
MIRHFFEWVDAHFTVWLARKLKEPPRGVTKLAGHLGLLPSDFTAT